MKLIFLSFLLALSAAAKTFKIATLVPKGTTWANNLQTMTNEIAQKTQNRVVFKIYYGGVSGDEIDVLRKIRIGQLHGALFTGRTLGEIYPDVRVMEVPFSFKHDRKLASKVLQGLGPVFSKGFEQKGFKNLGLFEIGNIYLATTKKVSNLKEARGIKIWAWEGDHIASLFAQEMKVVAVPLALPDVLAALSTGIVDAAYSSPTGMLALQWGPKIKYLMDFPVTYAIGAVLLSLPQWRKVKARDRKVVEGIVSTQMKQMSEQTAQENEQSLEALRSVGVEFVKFPHSDLVEADRIASKLLEKLQANGKLGQQIIRRFRQLKGQ